MGEGKRKEVMPCEWRNFRLRLVFFLYLLRMTPQLNSHNALGTTCVTKRFPSPNIKANKGPTT